MRFRYLIAVVILILLSVLGYLGYKYYYGSKVPMVTQTPALNQTPPPPDPSQTQEVDGLEGQIVCVETIETDMGDECILGLRTDDGKEYKISFKNKDLSTAFKIEDRVRINGIIVKGEFGKEFLTVEGLVKIR